MDFEDAIEKVLRSIHSLKARRIPGKRSLGAAAEGKRSKRREESGR